MIFKMKEKQGYTYSIFMWTNKNRNEWTNLESSLSSHDAVYYMSKFVRPTDYHRIFFDCFRDGIFVDKIPMYSLDDGLGFYDFLLAHEKTDGINYNFDGLIRLDFRAESFHNKMPSKDKYDN